MKKKQEYHTVELPSEEKRKPFFRSMYFVLAERKYSWYSLGSSKTDGYSFIDPPVRPILTEHRI